MSISTDSPPTSLLKTRWGVWSRQSRMRMRWAAVLLQKSKKGKKIGQAKVQREKTSEQSLATASAVVVRGIWQTNAPRPPKGEGNGRQGSRGKGRESRGDGTGGLGPKCPRCGKGGHLEAGCWTKHPKLYVAWKAKQKKKVNAVEGEEEEGEITRIEICSLEHQWPPCGGAYDDMPVAEIVYNDDDDDSDDYKVEYPEIQEKTVKKKMQKISSVARKGWARIPISVQYGTANTATKTIPSSLSSSLYVIPANRTTSALAPGSNFNLAATYGKWLLGLL